MEGIYSISRDIGVEKNGDFSSLTNQGGNYMKRKHMLALAIALALTAGGPPLMAQAADIEDAEYNASGGLDLINAAAAYRLGFTGTGVTLGVCD